MSSQPPPELDGGRRRSRPLAGGFAVLVTAAAVVAGSPSAAEARPAPSCAATTTARGPVDVVVVGQPGRAAAAAAAVRAAGGRVVQDLDLVDGVRATGPAALLGRLACSPAVRSVTPNAAVRFQGRPTDAADAVSTASDFVAETGAAKLWRQGATGRGIGVAVIDTGVSPMTDLSGRIVHGPDLSGEGTYLDSYGHGTVMAGIIGGDGAADPSAGHTGIAPDATLVSVKVAGRNGATDVSTMLAAMHWVSAYAHEFNIRVLNISWGSPSTQSATVDPLDYAVERLWRQGIVVVAAAGNSGPTAGTVLKPADDPMVLTVGAYQQSARGAAGATVPEWSSSGPTVDGYAKPDVVAPGRTLVALRAFGSQVEQDNPSALVAPSYIKGSGTSEATAVTSGAVALLLQARPGLTPDQVKTVLTGAAKPIARLAAQRQGAGRLSLAGVLGRPGGAAHSQTPVADGLGSLEASRGGHHVQTDCNGDGVPEVITGEIDVRCQPWDGASWTGGSWTGASWTGASWTGASWTGASWTGGSWTGASWTGASWTGGSWTGGSWFGASWTGGSWTGGSWTGGSWTGASWTGASWTGASWTSGSWSSELGTTPFLTAWWGDEPAAGQHITGERSG